ncbi:MAG TPA: hypothetical protein DEA08_29460 [Planctomycetes bacterium]|nr:hypothetical protein [Planctomycetota bacterium]
MPCPNQTAGILVKTSGREGADGNTPGLPVVRVPGGYVQFFGHPAVTPVQGGLLLGGQVSPRPVFGLPSPRGRGVEVGPDDGEEGELPLGLPAARGRVQPAPDGVPRGRRVPGDDPGRLPLGLPVGRGPGIRFEPPLGGGRGIPRGYEERLERARRRSRRARARAEYERREQERIDELAQLEELAEAAGRARYARRVRRARERIEKRRRKRRALRERRAAYKERKRREAAERRRRREERRERRRERRAARRRRRNRERMARRERGEHRRGALPQGGYWIRTRGGLAPEAGFGDWNAANAPLPFFGALGGPASLEDWAHLTTFQVRALQQVVNGAFGGPSYLAGNVAVVHRNSAGNPPAGSRLGAHWTASQPELKLRRGQAPLEVVSVLEAPAGRQVTACAGGVLEVVREHRGEGLVVDRRPLVLLENARAEGAEVAADMIADTERRFSVGAGAEVTGAKLRAFCRAGERGRLLEVARTDATGRVLDPYVWVDVRGGRLTANKGLAARGAAIRGALVLESESGAGPATRLTAGEEGQLRLAGADREVPVTLAIEGDVSLTGDLSVAGKISLEGSLDPPTDVQFQPQKRNPVPREAHGLWVSDGTEPGTVKGGLYYQRRGERVRLG